MAEVLSFDTCFLIDLEREQRGGVNGPAGMFVRHHLEAECCLSWVVFGEFAAGFERQDHPRLEVVRKGFELIETDEQTALVYARLYRHLRDQSSLIGANDLWIAACAVRHDLPLVTRNLGEFSRVPGLQVIAY